MGNTTDFKFMGMNIIFEHEVMTLNSQTKVIKATAGIVFNQVNTVYYYDINSTDITQSRYP